ncbi:acetate/CoA ligase [Advenella kashmirensis WT001]|uniref:Acetate/CoA ligase n=1 Tax=Advenella kashmirensis (strain DSM 17095 / LMG 22695 / WT001) TaxID=1036672 RepID=I3UBA5_ADVKW|nr:acetate/CoA ligase [Advenella kashmirensis WT001]
MSTSIESVLVENRVFPPNDDFVRNAVVSGMDAYKALYKEAEDDFEASGNARQPNICAGSGHSPRFWMRRERHFISGLPMAN